MNTCKHTVIALPVREVIANTRNPAVISSPNSFFGIIGQIYLYNRRYFCKWVSFADNSCIFAGIRHNADPSPTQDHVHMRVVFESRTSSLIRLWGSQPKKAGSVSPLGASLRTFRGWQIFSAPLRRCLVPCPYRADETNRIHPVGFFAYRHELGNCKKV